jgi:hypothetical protein
MQRSYCLCNLQPILEELGLVLKLHLVVNEDLSLIRDFPSLRLD